MRTLLFWLGLVLFLSTASAMVWKKEQLLAHGQTVQLTLAPVDPRSLMQGDYMVLRYDLVSQVPKVDELPRHGRLIVRRDDSGVASFVRLDDGAPLAEGELALLYRNVNGLHIGAESYFFQEGTAAIYQAARYAELKVDDGGTCLLTTLLDEARQPLKPASE